MTDTAFQRRLVFAGLFAAAFGTILGFWWLCTRSDDVAFLPARAGADWIVAATPTSAEMHQATLLTTQFRGTFDVPVKPAGARLTVRAFRAGSVQVNGVPVHGLSLVGWHWKSVQEADIAPLLRSGPNEIVATVTNHHGPPALWLRIHPAGADFDLTIKWEASQASGPWTSVRLAADPPTIAPGSYLDGQESLPGLAWRAALPVLGFAGLVALGIAWWSRRRARQAGNHARSAVMPMAPQIRLQRLAAWPALPLLVVGGVWIVLFANNLPQLPRLYGFDAEGHEEYIRYIQERGALPLADEGWQMYQPPLYYGAAALALEVAGLTTADEGSVFLLRGLNGVLGLAHCGLVFLCLRLMFPGERWKQTAGTLFACFLPAHLCLSHYVTNETLSATLTTAAVYCCLRALTDSQPLPVPDNQTASPGSHPPSEPAPRSGIERAGIRDVFLAGLALGAALLTKFSALLAAPVLLAVLLWPVAGRRDFVSRRLLQRLGAFLAGGFLVCGWHYVRVWLHFGRPIVGNWDAGSWTAWWQDPGYRTADYFIRFGEVFSRPLFSSLASFADGVYATLWGDGLASSAAWIAFRPPWNYASMSVAWLLALVATAFVGLGFVIGLVRLVRRPEATVLLWVGMPAAFVVGIVLMAIRVPSYAQVKAFYGLPALLPLVVLFLAGWEWAVARGRWLRPVLTVWFSAWLFSVATAFWVPAGNAHTSVVQAIWALDRGRVEDATHFYEHALQRDPCNADAAAGLAEAVRVRPDQPAFRNLLAHSLQHRGLPREAVTQYRALLAQHPDDPHTLNNLAWLLATHTDASLRDGVEAVRLAERACALTRNSEPLLLGTLAAAYAEAGRFRDAAETAENAIAVAQASGQTAIVERNQQLLRLYQAGKPLHETP